MSVPDAPTRITSARLTDVPPADPKAPPGSASAVLATSPIKQYCRVLGYVAPQNKFELRLPMPAQWNQRFHLTPCAGFCGALNGVFMPPSHQRLTPLIDWRNDAEAALRNRVDLPVSRDIFSKAP